MYIYIYIYIYVYIKLEGAYVFEWSPKPEIAVNNLTSSYNVR